jgi:hypothetical protein
MPKVTNDKNTQNTVHWGLYIKLDIYALPTKPNSYIYKLLNLTTNPNTKDVFKASWVSAYHKESSQKASRNITFGSQKYLLSFVGTLS